MSSSPLQKDFGIFEEENYGNGVASDCLEMIITVEFANISEELRKPNRKHEPCCSQM
jgi:hypothetical protein